ncbi:glycosyltransferase [Coprobacter fastidiosus]|jgi:1,2-diacylglycerol 3-alpha-glucosyltransferase|uniref:1,2-diacylglycerol 3-alpha-glucosyltransferase n=1 Tax=Coprobacter fastidiosus NSB1 = JCM 33896 TaxID=1349822 RepID=A0A495WEW3_9BACT|nr:glycosyltransferase [Coprobacter fastidiosus]ERM88482.1 hypothetical protein NSB1T_13135 [Coprobacter fastidiosus NSB1 = JCM 33896]RKT59724.1 1,2-diacylglycerol 3-alpha-glucosyltransferase [Coprobacter fastidiosus NSB1 = JCM 33896]BEG62061.1 hypothetical protein Cfast33896_10160 [Coprobacter fastidiosus]HJF42421.1 glycosyltransferase [Coprobacter fastidiosus]
MKVLILNSILFTAENNIIPKVKSIKDTMIYNLCVGFKNLGHEVTLAAAADYKPSVLEEYEFDILFFESELKQIFLPSVLPFSLSLYKFLKNNAKNFDFIISSEIFAFPSLFACMICPSKVFVWQELGVHNRKMKKIPSKVWYNIIGRFFMRRCFVVPRSYAARSFILNYHRNTSNEIIVHGMNFDNLKYSTDKVDYFITVGQLIYRKNIESIIRKFDLFLKKYNLLHYRLYIAGTGILYEDLRVLVKQLNLENSVIFLGHLSHVELNEYLSHAKAILLNSRMELNMISLSESIAVATPVITNLVPYSSYDVIQNKLGIAKDNWNEHDMMEIIRNNKYYVDNCLIYREQLSVEAVAGKFIALFNKKMSDRNN